MGQALYRKYRSKSLQEIVGQEHITQTLDQAIKSGRISHAYLFTGPRGVGKTSIARILAHQINDIPYTDDTQHMDIIEIDAASNRRIDEIRELRDKVYIAPTSAKYKVYIIDEVHMLTKEAFNALLKTLEEPPEHVVFILATTDAHKLPETIVSRTQRYSFRPVDKAKVIAHLKTIAKAEKIIVSDQALELLAEHGEGSFRDSISLLDQASSHGQSLELHDVQSLLGIPPTESIDQLIQSLGTNQQLVGHLNSLYDQGFQATAIAKQLANQLRNKLYSGNTDGSVLELLQQLIEVPVAHDPERFLEIVLLKAQLSTLPAAGPAQSSEETTPATHNPPTISTPSPSTKKQTSLPSQPASTPKTPPKSQTSSEAPEKKQSKSSKKKGDKAFNENIWPDILNALKQQYNTLYGIARMAQPNFTDDTLQLAFSFAFHQKRINEAKNRQIVADIVHDITSQSVQIECIVDKNAAPPKLVVPASEPPQKPKTSNLSTISNIFGGGELLES